MIEISKIINVDFDNSPYSIHIKRNIIKDLPLLLKEKTNNKKVIVIADSYFESFCSEHLSSNFSEYGFDIIFHYMDAGKNNKNIQEVLRIYAVLEENDFSRDSTLIALGGGVIGDLAGFVASTWYRGMNLVHIPTTLMAMVDSSVGGKVAINFRKTINGIGNYYHPILTLMDLEFIDSLSNRDYNSGLAEVIKCAIISDKKFFNYLKQNTQKILKREQKTLLDLVSRTIEIKIEHVLGDVKEGNKRLLLNYGHTLGHAIEISTEKNHLERYRHGEGVSIGIMAVCYIAHKYYNCSKIVIEECEKLLKAFNLPTFVDSKSIGFEKEKLLKQCLRNVMKDKKRINHKLRIILVNEIGQASINANVPFEQVEEAFKYIIQ